MEGVLVKGGIIRIIVPDIGKYLMAYAHEKSWQRLSEIRPLIDGVTDFWNGKQWNTRLELISELYRQRYEHRSAFDFETLHFILKSAGFDKILKQDCGMSLDPDLAIDWEERASESLYVEAVK